MSRADHGRRAVDSSTAAATRTALVRFVAFSVATLLLLAVGAVVVGERIAKQWAIDDARLRGAAVANVIAGSLVDGRVRQGNQEALGRLGAVLRNAMAHGGIEHVKLWTPEGKVLWSDEDAVVGQRFPLDPAVQRLFGTEGVTAELSTLDKAENTPSAERASCSRCTPAPPMPLERRSWWRPTSPPSSCGPSSARCW